MTLAPEELPLEVRALALWRSARGPLATGLIVIIAGISATVLSARPASGLLNPDAVDGAGSRAVVQLLRARGVAVTVARTGAEVGAAGPDATVLVTFPGRLGNPGLQGLHRTTADLVLLAPDSATLDRLVPGMTITTFHDAATEREPSCDLPAARAAGTVELDGPLYRATSGRSCYPGHDGAALVQLTDHCADARPCKQVLGRTVTVLNTPTPLTNGQLATGGNAALMLGLLGRKTRLLWYLPAPEGPPMVGHRQTLGELIPPGWIWAAIQLTLAAVLAALWRARRLGPVVREPLPVVVRAVEVIEGRSRLYRRAGASAHAADTLRGATRTRLASLVGLDGAVTVTDSTVEELALINAVSGRTGRAPNEVRMLLYGPAPAHDPGDGGRRRLRNRRGAISTAMIELADQLDTCEREVRRT